MKLISPFILMVCLFLSRSLSYLSISRSRNCELESALVQLSADIDFIYNDLTSKFHLLKISRSRLSFIQEQILNGLYSFSPLQVLYIKDQDKVRFHLDVQPDFPDIKYSQSPDRNTLTIFMPTNMEDGLVLLALSQTLFRFSYGCLPKSGYRLMDRIPDFYSSLEEMGKADRLIYLNLYDSFTKIPSSLILNKVKSLVGDGQVFKLVESVFYLPINNNYGEKLYTMITGGMVLLGDITMVLFDIILMDLFDHEFRLRYPGIAFSRLINDVFISTRENDKVIFDEKAGYALLDEQNLAGMIVSSGLGDDPILHCGNMIFLDFDSNVKVIDEMDYFEHYYEQLK